MPPWTPDDFVVNWENEEKTTYQALEPEHAITASPASPNSGGSTFLPPTSFESDFGGDYFAGEGAYNNVFNPSQESSPSANDTGVVDTITNILPTVEEKTKEVVTPDPVVPTDTGKGEGPTYKSGSYLNEGWEKPSSVPPVDDPTAVATAAMVNEFSTMPLFQKEGTVAGESWTPETWDVAKTHFKDFMETPVSEGGLQIRTEIMKTVSSGKAGDGLYTDQISVNKLKESFKNYILASTGTEYSGKFSFGDDKTMNIDDGSGMTPNQKRELLVRQLLEQGASKEWIDSNFGDVLGTVSDDVAKATEHETTEAERKSGVKSVEVFDPATWMETSAQYTSALQADITTEQGRKALTEAMAVPVQLPPGYSWNEATGITYQGDVTNEAGEVISKAAGPKVLSAIQEQQFAAIMEQRRQMSVALEQSITADMSRAVQEQKFDFETEMAKAEREGRMDILNRQIEAEEAQLGRKFTFEERQNRLERELRQRFDDNKNEIEKRRLADERSRFRQTLSNEEYQALMNRAADKELLEMRLEGERFLTMDVEELRTTAVWQQQEAQLEHELTMQGISITHSEKESRLERRTRDLIHLRQTQSTEKLSEKQRLSDERMNKLDNNTRVRLEEARNSGEMARLMEQIRADRLAQGKVIDANALQAAAERQMRHKIAVAEMTTQLTINMDSLRSNENLTREGFIWEQERDKLDRALQVEISNNRNGAEMAQLMQQAREERKAIEMQITAEKNAAGLAVNNEIIMMDAARRHEEFLASQAGTIELARMHKEYNLRKNEQEAERAYLRTEREATESFQREMVGRQFGDALKEIGARGAQERRQITTAGAEERKTLAQQIQADASARGEQITFETAMQQADRELQLNLQTADFEGQRRLLTQQIMAESAARGEQIAFEEAENQASRELQERMQRTEQTGERERLTAQIQADARARGQELSFQQAQNQADRQLQTRLAEMGIRQQRGAIQETARQERQTLREQEQIATRMAAQERQALAITTGEGMVEQARGTANSYVSELNNQLQAAAQGDFTNVETALSGMLPPSPPGIAWDTATGTFQQRAGFEGRQMDMETQRWIAAVTPAFKARDRAEKAVMAARNLQIESDTRTRERQQADADFREAMLTNQIDSAEEAIARQKMAETAQIENDTKMQNLQMLFNLMQNPVQLGMAKRHGLLGQIETVLGFTIGDNVPTSTGVAVIPNPNEWLSMDDEEKAFSLATYVEGGGSAEQFISMISGAAPAQVQQLQYGVL